MGATYSSSSFNPNPTPMGHGGHFTETQYRNQLSSANDHFAKANTTNAFACGGTAVGYSIRQQHLGEYKKSIADNMFNKGIVTDSNYSA